ncbi:hybrid sensor histidine kinase/response regulator [Halobacterium sp. KA-6]|uniref:hybrid sensor histidine kinase/response regulator n=1 Tax=Halobacterium sp. KA-6 TaxID=2896368 RepID=UPI001E494A4C|nr:response regulator [Halobacterium sp. KA-6]MCD2202331.1 response regulator [Halobacterium sp. KA-6]
MTDSIRVLHVDDEPGFAEMAGEFLEREDDRIEVETATNASDAHSILADEDVDCVVSDFDMPGQNGIEFLEAVREEYPELPFVLFTGKGSEEVASEAISAGATDYLQKEAGTDQYTILANRVLNYVDTARAKSQRQRQLDAIEAAKEGISILDEDGEFIYVNEAYADLYGYEPDDLVGEHWRVLYPDDAVSLVEDEILPQVREVGVWSGQTTGLRADGETFVEDHTLALTENDELVCTVRDITQNRERGEALAALHDAATDLEAADTEDEVYEILVDAAEDILDFDLVAVDVYDDDALVQAAWSLDADTEGYWEVTPLEEDTFATRAYKGQETIVVDDLREYEITPADPEYRSALTTPIADIGTFQAVSREPEAFGATDRELAELLAGHAREALTRLESEQQLRERTEELERQNERLEAFATIVSHDLRAPLNVASGRLALARDDDDSEHLEAVASSLDRMETLIEDTLTLAREGQAVSDREHVDVADVAEQCWARVADASATLNVVDEFAVRGDRDRLQQVFENLFRNAVEHGGEGVTVRVARLDDGSGFYVEDDGQGIPEDEREAVFGHGYTTSDDGTGFGLAIVEEIVNAHGWSVSVADSEDGARFEITGVELVERADAAQ